MQLIKKLFFQIIFTRIFLSIVKLIFFGRETYNKMIQNLIWATGYNVVAIPLAAGIFYPKFTLNPAIGAIFMTLSTVIVAINAELLKNKINIFNK